MLPGLRGRLLSHAYLEEHVLPRLPSSGEAENLAAFVRVLGPWWRTVTRGLGPASSARAVLDVALGPLLRALSHRHPATTTQPWGCGGMSAEPSQAGVLVLALPWGASLDAAWRDAVRGGLAADARWAIIGNGGALRVLDCSRTWARLWCEVEFEPLLQHPQGGAVLWALARREALAGRGSEGAPALASIVEGSERHGARVCRALGDGVLAALGALASALASCGAPRQRAVPAAAIVDQALTVVYRILFLLFAEARGVVPVWHDTFREAYTIDSLCRRIAERPDAPGVWDALQAIARMAHAGCRAGDLEVTAFNGRLFAPAHARLVESRRVPDRVAAHVVTALSTTDTPHGRARIAYHDIGVEQLGSVYERVLEYEPIADGRRVTLARTSTERKSTGSFYTPRSITEFLVRRTLQPLIEGRSAHDTLTLRVVDPAMGSGAFLVAACHYLAEHCERAHIADGTWRAGEVTAADRAVLRRTVAERCLYGVDRNPTAVQLARLSLWLTTLAWDRPLTFLDHHLAVGDSLVGARVADLARSPRRPGLRRPPPLPLFTDDFATVASAQVLPERLRLALDPSDTPAAVRAKERRLIELGGPHGPLARWQRAADAWCAALLWPSVEAPSRGLSAEMLAAALGGATSLPAAQLERWLGRACDIAAAQPAFHWDLAFPEVFFDADGQPAPAGGFDAVLGNPPWDVVRADTGTGAQRTADRERATAELRFFRESGVYTCQGSGHPNRYQLFLERAWQLTRPGGRFGLILPSGLATDHGSAALRRHVLDRCAVDTWFGFTNRDAIFPIHRSVRFVLLAATAGGSTPRLTYRTGLHDAAALDRYASLAREDPAGDGVSVTRSRLDAWDPEHATIPEIASAEALAVLTRASASAPPLASAEGWGARFGRELNATDDRPYFVPRTRRGALPVVEGKHLSPFRVDLRGVHLAVPRTDACRLLDAPATFARCRLAYRDVASATNRVTLIAALLPAGAVSTHTVFCLKTPLALQDQWCLLALLNSLPANYLVRLHVTTHVTASLMARLPVPRPAPHSTDYRELVRLARRLARAGVEAEADAYARLNAISAALYQFAPEAYTHVVSSFPLLPADLRARCVEVYADRVPGRNG